MTKLEELCHLATRSNREDAKLIYWAYGEIKRLEQEALARSWENPFSRAISVLEAQARAFEGSYG